MHATSLFQSPFIPSPQHRFFKIIPLLLLLLSPSASSSLHVPYLNSSAHKIYAVNIWQQQPLLQKFILISICLVFFANDAAAVDVRRPASAMNMLLLLWLAALAGLTAAAAPEVSASPFSFCHFGSSRLDPDLRDRGTQYENTCHTHKSSFRFLRVHFHRILLFFLFGCGEASR